MENITLINLEVLPQDVPYVVQKNQRYGIHVHAVREDAIDTDEMFNDSPIVGVHWFETKEERTKFINLN